MHLFFSAPSLVGFILLSITIVRLESCAQSYPVEYPLTYRINHSFSYHGIPVEDPYNWMENLESDSLHTWMEEQDRITKGYLSDQHLVRYLENRLNESRNVVIEGVPTIRGDRVFLNKREPGQTTGNEYVRDVDKENERLLIDALAMKKKGFTIAVSSHSPDGNWVTYQKAEGQSRWSKTYLVQATDGSHSLEVLEGFYRGRSNIAWKHDGSGFFYTRYPIPDNPQAPLGIPRIYFHTPGTPQTEDNLIYERPDDPALSYNLKVTFDDDYLIISASESGGTFNGLYDRIFYTSLEDQSLQDGALNINELFPSVSASFAFEGSDGNRFRIRTTHDAPAMRVVELTPAHAEVSKWNELIPEAAESIQAVHEIGDRLVVEYIRDARILLRIFDMKGHQAHEINLLSPSIYGLSDDRNEDYGYFGASILYDPGSVFKLNVKTGEKELYYRPNLSLNPDHFITEQVFYRSKDGTRVPMYLVYKKGLKRDGKNPTFLYAYGAWSWSAFPWQNHMIPWMEAGGIYAVANIRGGGEYGEKWHKAGIRLQKQNGIDDYIAAAEWLIEQAYTSSQKIVANGGSASGILPGAAITQQPGLFAATVINFPTLDKIKYDQFGSAKSWVPEFGDPSNPDDFSALFAYSPYHNINPNTCYPPTWIQVGEKDDTTTPMHGYKFAAALQHAQSCTNPILLKITWGAGHSYGFSPEQRRETQAQELAFLFKALGMDKETYDDSLCLSDDGLHEGVCK